MSRAVTTASTDQSIRVWAYDSSGVAITGEAYNSAGIAASVVVRSAGRILSTTALTLVARSGAGVHTDSAFTEVGSGEYVIDLADSYSATANRQVSVTLTSTAISGGYVLSETLAVGVSVELDPAARVKLDATQPDYAPATVAAMAAAKTILDKVDSGLVQDGLVHQFTANMLELAPAGGGGGGDAEQATLLEVQETVDALALSLAGTSVTIANRVSGSQITAYIGDDYKVRSGTELEITVSDTAGALHSKLNTIGVANLRFGASLPRKDPGQVTGTIASLSYAANVLTIAVEITACASGLGLGDYTYQIQSSQFQSGSYDDYIELEGTLIVKQRTVAVVG